ncbi:uncharacterized protein LOC111046968 [Nilaparvata lugens]|uniref:uncharacterized protein LOC111046968 n=1 Tax=Nilaparvata lugens TaxID=108931 RepID=UPI00193E7F1D|nr:uncharacterized protein LOC111046968 [Nilaparvata lugens]
MAFSLEDYANLINSFVNNLNNEGASETANDDCSNSFVNNLNNEGASETANDDCSKTSASSEHLSSIANKVIELNLLRNELINVEQDIADQDNTNRLKRCRLLKEKEANILTSLNEKLVFLNDEVQQIKLALMSFKNKKALLVPEEAQRDFLKSIDILSDFNSNLEKTLENESGSAGGNLQKFVGVFEKKLLEMKQAMCVLSETHALLRNENIRMKNLTKVDDDV